MDPEIDVDDHDSCYGSAAVCGSVFASPSSGQVKHGIELVDNEKGSVLGLILLHCLFIH